jgi:hypothetical protein
MNRTILIVICDFLLVSLLAFSTVDINKVAEEGVERQVRTDIAMATNQADSGRDLTAVMKVALDEERKSRDLLLGELTKTREAAAKQQTLLKQRDQQVQSFQQQLQSREEEGARLQQQQDRYQQQLVAAQTNLAALNQQLRNASVDALLSKERITAMNLEVRQQAENAAALQHQIAQLSQSNRAILDEKQRLATQLQVAEAEKRSATDQAARMEQQVKVEREEKARLTQQATKLAEGVTALASKSGELASEIRENRPLAANTIFQLLVTNRVEARLAASRPGLLGGDSVKQSETRTVLVTDGTNTYALCHVQETPLTLWNPGLEWGGLTGTLNRATNQVPIRSLSFCLQDPRVVFVPLTPAETRQLGATPYRLTREPYKFQDAVLVGAREGYYGECKFQFEIGLPDYVKLDTSFVRGLFGKFNPSRGDLVFSKTGELLGIMANSTYCMMIRDFVPAATFRFAKDVRDQQTGFILSQLYSMVQSLPNRLQ